MGIFLGRVTLALLVFLVIGLAGAQSAPLATFMVANTNDSGLGSLREAILDANEAAGADSITFDLEPDETVIDLASPLPNITDPVDIDGQVGELLVTLDGGAIVGDADGLVLATGSNDSTIENLEIRDFQSGGAAAIRVESSQNVIAANVLWSVDNGVIVADAGAANNVVGVEQVEGQASGEGNEIWDFTDAGVGLDAAGTGNHVAGNTIGLDPDDQLAAGDTGIAVDDTAGSVIGADVGPDGLGGMDFDLGNVVVGAEFGEGAYGIALRNSATNTIVAGNFVGTDRDSTTGLGNQGAGIRVSDSSNNQLGPGNTVTGNGFTGTGISVGGGTGSRIVANSIYDNEGKGIELAAGANNDLARPQLLSAEVEGGTADIVGNVSGVAGRTYFLEIFRNSACDDTPLGGEGKTFVEFRTVIPADETDDFTIAVSGISPGEVLTATLTDSVTNDTSEFSNCVTVTGSGGGGSLSGGRAAGSGNYDLTTEGTADWAVWGFSTGGEQCTTPGDCSTSLAPDVRKSGGSAISDLVDINAAPPPIPLRGIGFVAAQPFTFAWSDGSPAPPSETNARTGLQHNGGPPPDPLGVDRSTLGTGFSFTVPADTTPRTLKVWVAQNRAGGQFTAALSDGSAAPFSDSFDVGGLDFVGSVYSLTYEAASAGQTLTVNWVENADNCVEFRCDNVSIHAVALSGPGGGDAPDPPVLFGAVPDANGVAGLVEQDGLPADTEFEIQFFSSETCEDDEPGPLGGPRTIVTNANGIAAFALDGLPDFGIGTAVTARARLGEGSASDLSNCVIADRNNTSWPTALPLGADDTETGHVRTKGQARWFKVPILPNSRVNITLSELPADYDLVVFSDIQAAYDRMTGGAPAQQGPNLALDDLNRQGAETPVDLFNTSQFNPNSWDPTNWDPTLNNAVFSPTEWSPTEWSPTEWSASTFSPTEWSPTEWSPTEWSPTEWSPTEWSPTEWSESQWSPTEWSSSNPADPRTFSAAQTASLLAISATPGTGVESVSVNTWNNTGFFYVRVQGRNGSFDPDSEFTVDVEREGSLCEGVLNQVGGAPDVADGNFRTLVLVDRGRLPLPDLTTSTLNTKLKTFIARPEVDGTIVNVGADATVGALNTQADARTSCPFAKNLVAARVKRIVDAHDDAYSDLEYVVVVGGDSVIPFFRSPDPALLGNETRYTPPVRDDTASQASLRLGYVLTDDFIASSVSVSLHGSLFPVPDMAIGRLVETPQDIEGMVDAYLGTTGGVVPTPTSSLTTGYDFLTDTADQVAAHLQAGIGGSNNETLITNQAISPGITTVGNTPDRNHSWTATDLRRELFTESNDLVFLAGHFSANDALAADYRTNVLSTELPPSSADLVNSIVFSAGCHAGYNIVNGDATLVTEPLDWAQAFARKRATLIAGTGYQYGDTDFIAHSERIYLEFARQLRLTTGPGEPIAVGGALLRSKQNFLEATPGLSSIDEKALLETTLFGFPMLSVDLPQGRFIDAPEGSVVPPIIPQVGSGPGAALGLKSFDLGVDPTLTLAPPKQLKDGPLATWLNGPNDVAVKPTQPILPLESVNVTPQEEVALRGVGFRGGSYVDTPGVTPLTGAPATELRGIHAPFFTDVFFPTQPWTSNYFDALGGGSGTTQLHVTPVQHVSTGLTMTRRVLSDLDLRLFYSGNVTSYCPGTNPLQVAPCIGPPPRAAVAPALSAPPTITDVDTSFSGGTLTFEAHVVGELVAGIQGVWVTWTIPPAAGSEGRWAPIDLVQDTNDPSLWTGELMGISNPANVHFLVQAVNGVGKVTVDDNLGAFYRPGSIPGGPPDPNLTPTTLAFTPAPPGTVEYGDSFSVTATLTSGGNPLPGKTVRIGLGAAGPPQTTNASGQVTTIVRAALSPSPNPYPLTAAFSGDTTHAASDAVADIVVTKQPTSLAIAFPVVTLTASTTPQPTPLHDRTVIVTLLQGGDTRLTFVGRTDPQGRVRVPASLLVALPQGSYTVVADFDGDEGYAGAVATAGNGLNVIRRGSGSDRINGTDGSDLIIDTGGSNTIDGRGGNDVILLLGNGSHTILGGTGDDWIETGSGSDKIDGGAGNDTIHAGDGSNDVKAGSGDDVITAGRGSDKVDGGAGFDACHADGGSNNVSNCEA